MYRHIKNRELRKQISLYKRLHNKRMTLKNYSDRQKLEDKTENVIDSFENGTLQLDPSQYKLFAKYISAVVRYNTRKNTLYDILQKKADFDVRKVGKRANLSWFKKIFNIDPDKVPYMPKSTLNRKINRFKNLCYRFNKSAFAPSWIFSKLEKLHKEARTYMQAFIDDKITIKPEDRETFKQYMKVLNDFSSEEVLEQKCLAKLKTLPQKTVSEKKSTKKTVGIGLIPFKMTKIKTKSEKKNHNHKTAVATLLIAFTGLLCYLGLSNKENIKSDSKKDKTEQKTKPVTESNQKQQTRMLKWDEAVKQVKINSNVAYPKIKKPTETLKQKTQKETPEITPEHQAIINHHNHVIKMRLGEKQADALDKKIEDLRQSGILSLPRDISNAEVAYAFVMYRAYGVQSSLSTALNSEVKLSQAENQKVLEDIKAVGSTGLGVKKMAEAKHKGELNNHSCYDNASVKDQKQHVKNLKQLHQLQKAKQRAA